MNKFFFILAVICGSALSAETTFVLVRHGQTDWNLQGKAQGWSDIPLNKMGRKQAKATAKKLYLEYPDLSAIYSSDLCRAHETARATAQLFNLTVTKRKDLREINNGSGEGMLVADKVRLFKPKWDAFRELYPHRKERWDHVAIEGEETLNALAYRCRKELQKIADNHPNQKVAIFSHSKAIRTVLADVMDVDITEIPPLGNADVRIIIFNDGEFEILHKG